MTILLARIAAALVSGALLAQAYGLAPLWPLAWIAPVPLLIASVGASRLAAFACGAIAGIGSMALMLAYFVELSGPVPALIITLAKALMWGGLAFAMRGAAARLPAWAAVFVFPALFAGLETLIASVSPHGSAGALAYSQMGFLPAIQVASLGGAPAISFTLALFASAFAFVIAKRTLLPALAPVAIVAAVLAFGVFRFAGQAAPALTPLTPIALLADDQFEGVPDEWPTVWAAYAPQIERAADENVRIILLPEKIAHLDPAERGAAIEQLAEIARRRDLLLVVGVDDEAEEGRFNRALVFTRDGWQSYDKRHMIPGYESHFALGDGPLMFEREGVRFGVAVCKDMDFPALGRGYAGVDVMLVPAWDFATDAWLHSRMAVLRGVENGYVIVRSARNGALTVSGPDGAILAESQSGSLASFRTEADVHGLGPTLYSRIGDAFGWAMLTLAGLLFGWSVLPRRR